MGEEFAQNYLLLFFLTNSTLLPSTSSPPPSIQMSPLYQVFEHAYAFIRLIVYIVSQKD